MKTDPIEVGHVLQDSPRFTAPSVSGNTYGKRIGSSPVGMTSLPRLMSCETGHRNSNTIWARLSVRPVPMATFGG